MLRDCACLQGPGSEAKPAKPPGSVYSLAMTPSGTLLAAGSSTAIIRMLDPRSGQKVTEAVHGMWGMQMRACLLLAGCAVTLPATHHCWLMHLQVCKLRGHTDTVRCLLLTADGSKLVSGASDGSIKLWDVGMGRAIQVRRNLLRGAAVRERTVPVCSSFCTFTIHLQHILAPQLCAACRHGHPAGRMPLPLLRHL